MSMCSLLLCCCKGVFAMTSAFSWQNSITFCPASFCTPRPNLPITLGVSWLPTFAFQSPIMKSTSFLGVLKGLVGLHRIVQLQLLQRYRLGPRLGLLWYWMVCLGNELDCTWITPLQLLSPRTPFGLPWFLSSKEPTCQYRRKRFDPWVRKMPWKRIRQPTLVFSLGKCHGQRSLVATVYGVGQEEKKSWTRYSNYIADHPLSSYS